jgi:hypothetical protein
MSVTVTGMTKAKRMLAKITPAVIDEFEKANRENAELIVDVAKVLAPVKSGATRAAIRNVPAVDGGQLIDFGPLSKILEGGTAPRFHKSGKSVGSGPARPFVNPALQGTKKKRTARNRKAVKAAIQAVKNG